MFTFGRAHEKVCAVQRVRGEKNIKLVSQLIDAMHDFLDKRITQVELLAVTRKSFVEGNSGVWEPAANWLQRLGNEYPDLLYLWLELTQHYSANVRFRVACCLPDMTPELAK
jgi:hypothetical protein